MKLTKKERSWVLYDWANSAYSIVIGTAVFPLFYETLAGADRYVVTWGFANSAASLVVALLAPILGTIADYKGRKKGFFSFFFGLGVAATLGLSLMAEGRWLMALLVYATSRIGFSGANLFYDAFLVDVSDESRMDAVSTRGFGWGYIGSTIPFILGILLILNAEALGFESADIPTRITFIVTGVWWGVFSIPILKNVSQVYYIEPSKTPLRDAFARLVRTFRDVRQYKNIFVFLAAYFFYAEGVNTIIYMATPIATRMGIDSTTLLVVLLAIQVVAFPFAILYGQLAKRFTGRTMIFVGIFIYTGLVLVAFMLPTFQGQVRVIMFWVLSMMVATSQGGIQALSRSYFAKIVPKEKSTEFFGFYNIVGKFSAILGPQLVAIGTLVARARLKATGRLVEPVDGVLPPDAPIPERWGVLLILILFIVGGLLLTRTKREENIVPRPEVSPIDDA